jgi:hypothetical protein
MINVNAENRNSDGTCVSYKESKGRYLWRSEPFEAIHNTRYFIDSLAIAETLHASSTLSGS